MSFKEKLKPSAARKKYVLIIFNLLFLITGICMISIGSYLTVYSFEYYGHETTYEHFFDIRFFSVVNTLYTIGIIMSAVSFLGCVGAFTENIFILMLFSVCLATVFVLEATFAATGYIMREQVKESLTNSMDIMMHDYGTNAASRRTVDTLQRMLGCCGVNSCEEWDKELPMYISFISEEFGHQVPQPYIAFDECRINTTDGFYRVRLPSSCCGKRDNYGRCLAISEHGCIPQLGFLVRSYYTGIAGLIAVLQITDIVLACLLAKALYIQKIKRGMKYSLLREELVRNDS